MGTYPGQREVIATILQDYDNKGAHRELKHDYGGVVGVGGVFDVGDDDDILHYLRTCTLVNNMG